MAIGAKAKAQQAYVRPTEGVTLPATSSTEVNDATALSINPANIGFLDSWSFVYAGSRVVEQRHLAGQGHGLFLAFPIGPFGLAVSTEFMNPPKSIMDWQGLDSRMRFSLGMSFNPVRSMGFGIAYRTFYYYDLGDVDTFDLSLTVRPANQLALSFVFSDANSPDVEYHSVKTETGARIPLRLEQVPRRFGINLTLRPFGNDRLYIGAEMTYLNGMRAIFNHSKGSFYKKEFNRTDAAAHIGWMIVDGITLKGRFGAEGLRDSEHENGYFIDASLTFDSRRLPFGVSVGSNFQAGPKDKQGFQAVSWTAGFSGAMAPSVPLLLPPVYGASFALDKRLDSYEEARLMGLFERAIDDDSVKLIVLKPRPGVLSTTQAQELRRRIFAMSAAGKKTVCYLTEATAPVYLACSGADEVWINPAGGLRLTGLSTHAIFFKDLMDKLGVTADMIRIGAYKSAPESFTRTEPTAASFDAMNRMMDSIYNRLLSNLASDRALGSIAAAGKLIDDGPYTASESLSVGLVDKIIFADELNDELNSLMGNAVVLNENYGNVPLRRRSYLDSPAVAVVHIQGDIVAGESMDIPFLGIKKAGAKTITKELRKLGDDPNIRAVVLRINSPGGSALASDLIWKEVMSLRKKKPVIASLGSVAASGGYYIASAANVIYSEPTTITGSIGIFYGKVDMSGLLGKIGIDLTTYKRGAHADMESWMRPYTPEERHKMLGQLREFYHLFLDRVVEGRGRGFTREIVDKRGRGRIWTGADAKYHLLVDHLGGYQEALDHARSLGFVARGTRVFHVPTPKSGLIKRIVRSMFTRAATPSALEQIFATVGRDLKRTLAAALPFTLAERGAPQARLPYGIIEQ